MSNPEVPPAKIKAFLSCSIRKADRPLVDALDRYVLAPMGFTCVTVGGNVSQPDQPDDVIRHFIDDCHCLIGVATQRLVASDADLPERCLVLATPYLLQETAAAHQVQVPFLIVKTPDVTLQGVAARNLYLEVEPILSARGRIQFKGSKELVLSSLRNLKQRAEARSRAKQRQGIVDGLKTVAACCVGGYSVLKVIEGMSKPDCIGEFYYKDRECQDCAFKADCKAEKVRRQA